MVENNNIEYKRELADSIEKDVVSFLNVHGGEIYIGMAGTTFWHICLPMRTTCR